MKKFSLKKKIIIGIMSFLLICILSLFGLAYIAISGLSEAMADSYSKIYTPNEVPSDTFLLAVTDTKGGLDFIDYRTYQQDKISSKPSFRLFEGNQGSNDCGLKIICDIRKDGDIFRVNQRDILGLGITDFYKISNNQIIPISMTCSTSECLAGRRYPQQTP